ncbi:proclotting enzyme isoform X2 [Aedes aegypti]|uniref:Phenoloxidase-activating factor 2 n=1 Tax=Aedes aegypti TaxID=7159 RepID=A0A6I8T6V8_AEDAE|nr:proclotting enzyme isoform X2 [Aedes aegypti]
MLQTCHLVDGKEGICVYSYLCENDVINTDGDAIIDLRFSDECEDYFLKCCSKESSCMERAGTCLPKSQCGADLNTTKYEKFKESKECDWSGYQCCPNDANEEDSTGTEKPDVKDSEVLCGDDSICVPIEQCTKNADGENLLEARSAICSELSTCCPQSQIKKVNVTNSCDMIGGTCMLSGQCETPNNGTEKCLGPEHVCCMDKVESTTIRETASEAKTCLNNKGVCTEENECDGKMYNDRRNECGGLVCCSLPQDTDTSSESTCDSLGGTCKAEQHCREIADRIADCAEDTVCCLSNGSSDTQAPTDAGEVSIKECGYRIETGIKFNTINRDHGESQYGEFPWVVAIMVNESANVRFTCSGTLIDPEVVITAAECVKLFRTKPEQLIVRAGEWDMGATMEPIPYQERRVRKIKSHVGFKPLSLINNIAILFLEDKFDLTSTVNTVCVPPQGFIIDNGEVTATGWGTTPKNRKKFQQILKSIDLPYVQKPDCEKALRRATRNNKFKLHSSFICAGGEDGVDTCQGDAGSPIIFPIPDDPESRYYAVGMVAWGVGCGRSGTPSVYTDIGQFREWIDEELANESLSMYYYDYQLQGSNDEQ